MNRITILLADDHVVVRQGVRALLGQETDFLVVGEADDGLQLIELVGKLRPNVVVIDLKMPNLNGLDAVAQVHRRHPSTRIVILTMHADRSYVERALKSGASGYVLKDENIGELCMAIRHAAQGISYLSPEVTRRVPVFTLDREEADPLMLLSHREREVFHLIAEGKTNNEAARILGISTRTVEVHRSHVMKKLNLRTHIDLVRFALQQGILAAARD